MSCTSCLSNDDIQTPDQVRAPCTTPYFHKDTLTPPSSLRSPPSTYAARDASLYNARPILSDYTKLIEVIRLMSIAGYEAYVIVCYFMYKTVCAAFILLPWNACNCLYVCLYCGGIYLIHNLITKKYRNKNEKHLKKNKKWAAAAKRTIYLLTTTPIDSSHSH